MTIKLSAEDLNNMIGRDRVTTVNVGGMTLPLAAPIRGIEIVELVKVIAVEGDGETTPMHRVNYYFTRDGELIARRSTWPEDDQ